VARVSDKILERGDTGWRNSLRLALLSSMKTRTGREHCIVRTATVRRSGKQKSRFLGGGGKSLG
jgi:hypothetical protein